MKNTLFILLLSSLFALTATAQSAPRQATARIFETTARDMSRIVIVYENGQSEVIPLQNIKFLGLGSLDLSNQDLVENQKTINKMFNDMDVKGYDPIQITNSNWGETTMCSFILFRKRE